MEAVEIITVETPLAVLSFTAKELLALAVIQADGGELKPDYDAAHRAARDKCHHAYLELTKRSAA